jgi:hypothetical protein
VTPTPVPAPDSKEDMLKYLVTDNKGEFVIELPDDGWKITFAHVNPAAPERGFGGDGRGYCLRVYKGKELRAVFGNVTGIRDLAIPLARKVERQTGSSSWTMDSAGNFEGTKKVEVDHLLIEPDDDQPF